MARQIFTRSFWSFIALADIFAAISLYELSVPKNRTIAYMWDISYDWKVVVLGLACVAVAIAVISLAWPALHTKRLSSSSAAH